MGDLLDRARIWIAEVHPHARHLERTREWLLVLDADAAEATAIAAVVHDIERAFPVADSARWDSARDWNSPEYNRWHQDRCALLAATWLREQGADSALVRDVEAIVRVHEDGGWREADLVQAADSLSFLETMVPLVLKWAERGYAENAEAKLRYSIDRIAPSLGGAREMGAPLLDAALAQLSTVRSRLAR
jgi:hypothetical protein